MTKTQVEVITSVQRRRSWSRSEKERIVTAAMEPGAVASEVARAAGLHVSQLFRWRQQLCERSQVPLLPKPNTKHQFIASQGDIKAPQKEPPFIREKLVRNVVREQSDGAAMDDNTSQKTSNAFRLPALDSDFLLGDSMRGVRLQLEYAKAEERLRAWIVRSTIVVFGSARVLPKGREDSSISTATLPPGASPRAGDESARWYEEARHFGRIASERGGALISHRGVRDNVIATGGGPGIMEAANRGASDAGAPSIGFNIGLPHEQEPNAYSTPDLTFQFHYFAVRKLHFAMRANALVVFPGGFGTLDELFELLTLIQTHKMPPVPVLLIDKSHWTRIINFGALAEEGMIARTDLDLFSYADDAEGAWQELVKRGLKTGPRPPGYPSKID